MDASFHSGAKKEPGKTPAPRNFVGVASHGKNGRYRYYMCWTRNRYGAAACDAGRIRADALEAAVFDALVDFYSDAAVLREATADQLAGDQAEAAERAGALRDLDAEVRKAEAAVERYMLAFEEGNLATDVFSERVEQLAHKAQALRSRRDELAAAPASVVPDLSDDAVRAIFDELSEAAADAPEAVKKALAQAFVHELRVLDHQTVQPTFRVLPGSTLDSGPLQPQQGCAYTDKQSGPGLSLDEPRSGCPRAAADHPIKVIADRPQTVVETSLACISWNTHMGVGRARRSPETVVTG